jgi:hypothetical protein
MYDSPCRFFFAFFHNVTCDFTYQFYVERDGGERFETIEAKGQPDDIIKALEGRYIYVCMYV